MEQGRVRYMLEYAELYIVPTELTKNRAHQTYRWKQLAMSNDLEELYKHLGKDTRIVDQHTGKVVAKMKGNLVWV